jgi:general nucleoside transport system ATP-binding protein
MSAMLEMGGICKRYGAVQANRKVDLTVPPSRIVGLLGENGSGKSTLMKVLFGMVKADAGTIRFKGHPLAGHSPRDAIAAGIGMIHQHFMLVEAMTVAENVMLGWERAGNWLRTGEIAQLIRNASKTYSLDLDPEAVVGQLSLGRRQRIEIVKAILRGADLLILDEPTSNLSPPEVSGLFGVMRRLRQEGRSVIFISHKLGEVLEICDEVVVLRDGEVVGLCPVANATRGDLARMMVGREINSVFSRSAFAPGKEMLRLDRLTLRDRSGLERLRDITFSLNEGEILAIAGVDGNGQTELVDSIAGLKTGTSGRISLAGRDITSTSARARLEAGIAYIPVDRASTSLVPGMTIADNLGLRDFDRPPLRHGPWLNGKAFRREANSRIAKFGIVCGGPHALAQALSGGNQQKIVVAREIGRQPRVLIAFQPTWGLDPGATRYVIEELLALRNSGGAILYVSSDLEEVLAIGDRIAVMFNGRLSRVFDRNEVDITQIGLMMAGQEYSPDSANGGKS